MIKKFTPYLRNFTKKTAKLVVGAALTISIIAMRTTIAYAADNPDDPTKGTGVDPIDFGIGKLIGLFLSLVSAYGIIQLIKDGTDFFSAMKDRDSGSMKQAGLGMLAGFGIASIGGVLAFLGFKW